MTPFVKNLCICVLIKQLDEFYTLTSDFHNQFSSRNISHVRNCIKTCVSSSLYLRVVNCCQRRWEPCHPISSDFGCIRKWARRTFSISSKYLSARICGLIRYAYKCLHMSQFSQIRSRVDCLRVPEMRRRPTVSKHTTNKGKRTCQQHLPLNPVRTVGAYTDVVLMDIVVPSTPSQSKKTDRCERNTHCKISVSHSSPFSSVNLSQPSNVRKYTAMPSCPISSPCPLETDPHAIEVDRGTCPRCRRTFHSADSQTELPPTLLELAIMEATNREAKSHE